MDKTANIIYKLVAIVLIIIGLASMIAAWDLLLVMNSHSITVLGLEIGGVVLCLAGYFLWKRSKMPGNDMARSEDMTAPAEK